MIHFICALKSEAQAIIKYFELTHLQGNEPYHIYLNKNKQISLTLSGIGKIAAAAATAFTFSRLQCGQDEIWLNLGIAGHKNHAIGEIYLCHQIEDAGNNRRWYPQLVFDTEIRREKLLTLDKPSIDYMDCLFDMEASGFISTASKFSRLELIHSLKIVSDNTVHPAAKMSVARILSLISPQLDAINVLMGQLLTLSNEIRTEPDISEYREQFLLQWRFSSYQRGQLEKVLTRWQVSVAR